MTVVSAIVLGLIAWYTAPNFFRGWAIVQLVLLPFALRKPREPLFLLLAL